MQRAADTLRESQRLVVKIGSSLLVDSDSGLRQQWLDSLMDDLAALHNRGCEILLVSSGAIALGRKVLSLPSRPLRLDENQAAASVGQIELARSFSESLHRHNLVASQILLTLNDTEGGSSRRTYLNARDTIHRLLSLRAVPVINENDTIATSEIRYGDNDRLAARVATMMGADLLVLLSDIEGLYSSPPDENPQAEFIECVDRITPAVESMAGCAGSELSRGGMVTKIEAGKITTSSGTSMIITSGKSLNPLKCLESGCRATLFLPHSTASAKKKWIAGQLETSGSITIDKGAVRALHSGKSLLPAGVTKVEGRFSRGDTVAIMDESGIIIARGLIGYDCDDAQLIAGKHSDDLSSILGYEGRATMIHRDNMALSDSTTKESKDNVG